MARLATGISHSAALGVDSALATYTEWTLADSTEWTALAVTRTYSTGSTSFFGIKADGSLWGWGANTAGVLGLGDSVERITPTEIIASGVARVASSNASVYVVKTNGTLWVWGANDKAQLGLGDTTLRSTPVQVGSATDWFEVAPGDKHAIATKTGGTLYSCGENTYGCTGQGTYTGNTTTWTQIGTDTDWENIACGLVHCLATKTDGTLYAWGSNGDSQFGSTDDISGYIWGPIQLSGGDSEWIYAAVIVGIAAHDKTSIIWQADGTSHAAGDNAYGRLGVGTANTVLADWTEIPSLDVDRVFASNACTLIITLAGAAYGAGSNTSYGLGIAGGADVTTFTAIPAIDDAVAFASGYVGEASQASIVSSGTITGPMTLTVSNPSGTIEGAMTLTVTESGSISAPMNMAVIPDITAAADVTWSAACTIDGASVSSTLIGSARVVIAEGAARVATVSVKPPSGALSPLDYVGKTITLDYVWGGAVRLFTGWVDTPEYDFDTGILTLTCSDNLQNRVAALPREEIDELVEQSLYSADVQGDITDNWDYAQALLSTVQGSVEAGPNGDLRFTTWLISSGASFSSSNLLYQRSRLKLPQRSAIINEVNCTFKYRYPRLRQRNASLGWSGTHIDMAPAGYRYPTQQDFYGAAGGSGWFVTLGLFWPAPASIPHSSGGFIYPEDGSIDMAVLHLAHRHAQTVTETWEIRYYAPLSIDINGTNASTLVAATESSFDGRAWESAIDIEPLLPGGGAISLEEWDTALGNRAALAREVMENIATARMVGSHRTGRVTNATILNPALDVNGGASISTAELSASGKLVEVIHTMDFDSGSAVTEFSIAYFSLGGTGTPPPHYPGNPIGPSTISGEADGTQDWESEVTQLSTNVYGITSYSDNLMGILINPPEFITVHDVPSIGTKAYPNASYTAGSYPVTGFRIRMPGVDDADRNPIDTPLIVNNWEIDIPEGTLTFTVP